MSQPSLLEHSQGMGELQLHCPVVECQMAMGQYLLIPFSGGWTSIYQLFWCELQGYKILTHCQISKIWNHRSDEKNATPLHLWIVVGCFWCTRRCVYAGRQPHGVSFHCTSACETIIWIQYQWFGLRENLQETIHFPISMEFSCKCQSLNQSIDSRWEFQTLTWLQNVDHVCRCLLYPSTDSCLTQQSTLHSFTAVSEKASFLLVMCQTL